LPPPPAIIEKGKIEKKSCTFGSWQKKEFLTQNVYFSIHFIVHNFKSFHFKLAVYLIKKCLKFAAKVPRAILLPRAKL
jgi:hypothetical protein